LNRLELGALSGETRYKKIIARPEEIEALLIEEGAKPFPERAWRSSWILIPVMTLCMATRKELSFTVITGTIVTCPFTAFAATSRSWRNCETASAMSAAAQ
jgi:hypothetical protein